MVEVAPLPVEDVRVGLVAAELPDEVDVARRLQAAMGTLADQKLTIVVHRTATPKSDPQKRSATVLFEALSAIFAPDRPVKF